ncbi:MAG: MoaD/ThiS family protein [Planctomycetaceae bacterium]|jgi:molybdopterin synthase sulfur carrier subunit
MKLSVQLFARARDLAGGSPIEIELPDGSDVAALKRALAMEVPALSSLGPHMLVAVGEDYARDGQRLVPGVEIACFPPVSGG